MTAGATVPNMAPDPATHLTVAAADRAAIDTVVEVFFAAFASGDTSPDRWDALRDLFLPEAVVVRTCGLTPTVYDVDGFIAPRASTAHRRRPHRLPRAGAHRPHRPLRRHAQWFGGYAKAGVQDGTPLTGRGMKSIQLVRTAGGWRISAAAWDDEWPASPTPTRPEVPRGPTTPGRGGPGEGPPRPGGRAATPGHRERRGRQGGALDGVADSRGPTGSSRPPRPRHADEPSRGMMPAWTQTPGTSGMPGRPSCGRPAPTPPWPAKPRTCRPAWPSTWPRVRAGTPSGWPSAGGG